MHHTMHVLDTPTYNNPWDGMYAVCFAVGHFTG